MKRRLPIAAAVAAARGAASRPRRPPPRPASRRRRGFVPAPGRGQVRGQRRGAGAEPAAGVGVRRGGRGAAAQPAVAYAAPNYIATASATAGAASRPQRPRHRSPAPPGPPGGLGLASSGTSCPGRAPRRAALPVSPGGHRRDRRLAQPGRGRAPGRAGRHRRRPRHRHRLPRPSGSRFRRSPDFAAGQFVKGYDFVDDDRLPLDENGHGTHVAGTIAEKTNNGIGLTGLAYRAKLMPVRVLDRHGRGQADDIAQGIRFAVAHGADVINMSFNFGCGKKVPGVDEALRDAYRQGVVTVASVGNLGSEACVSPPATGPRVIGVGGTHRGRLPRQLLAGRRGRRPARARAAARRSAGCPSVSARPIYQVTLQRRQPAPLRRARQLRRHLDGRRPRLRRRGDGPRQRHRSTARRPAPRGRSTRRDRTPAQHRPRPRPAARPRRAPA